MSDTPVNNGFELVRSSLLYHKFPCKVDGLTELDQVLGQNFMDFIDHDDPMMVYMANGKIVDLEKVEHPQEVRDYLNERSLHIYLYEPLCSYIIDDPYADFNQFNNGFHSEFSNKECLGDVGTTELDSIELYIKKNKLHNVIVHTGDYQVARYYSRYTMYMDLICDDAFIKSFAFIDNVSREPKQKLRKKFLSTNWRFTPARAVISALLCKKDANLAWYYEFDQKIIDQTPWFDFENSKLETPRFYKKLIMALSKLNSSSPWCLDFKTDETVKVVEAVGHYYPNDVFEGYGDGNNPVFQNRETPTLEPFYRESFVDIVCESRYAQPTGNFSEKVLQSIHFMTPFVLVAPPYTLQYLKEFGFESFSEWWDESYDEVEDHALRMQMISDIIDYIDSLSWKEINNIYAEMLPLLQRNRETLDRVFTMQPPADNEEARPKYAQWLAKDHGFEDY